MRYVAAAILLAGLCFTRPAPLLAESAFLQSVADANRAYRAGNTALAEKKLGLALKQAEQEFGAESVEFATVQNELGGLDVALGRFREAEVYYNRALDIRRKVLGPTHPDYALVMNNIGYARMAAGDLSTAVTQLEQAYAILSSSTPPFDERRAVALSNLGEVSFRLQRLNNSKDYFQRALDLRKAAPIKNDSLLAVSYHNLAYVMSALGVYTEALPFYEQALEISRRVFSEDDPRIAHAFHNLGEALREIGNEARAEEMLKEALAIREHAGAPETEVTLASLSELYAGTDRSGLAKPLAERALKAVETRAGAQSPELLPLLEQLAVINLNLDKLEESERLYRRAVSLAPRSPALLNNLAYVLVQRGSYEEACSLYGEAFSIRSGDGSDNPSLVRPLRDLARCEVLRKKPELALELLTRAQRIQNAQPGAAADTVEILSEMASAYQLAGDQIHAEQTLRRAQQLASDLYGKGSGEALEFEKRLRDLSRTSGSGQ